MVRSWCCCPARRGRTPIQMVGTPAARVTSSLQDEVRHRLRRKIGAGEHQLGPDHHRRLAQPPGVGVEHGDHREDHVRLAHGQGVGETGPHRVQDHGPVGVQDTFRVAGRPARVAHRRRRVFVGDSVEGMRRRRRHQFLVVDDAGVVGDLRRPGSVTAIVHHDHMPDRLAVVDVGPQRREQAAVGEDDLVLGVIGDVDELVGEEPDVEGVQHSPGARRREVQLQVASAVPGEGGDATVGGDPEVIESAAESAGCARPTLRRWCARGRMGRRWRSACPATAFRRAGRCPQRSVASPASTPAFRSPSLLFS